MDDKFIDLEILTPFEIICQHKITYLRAPGIDGYFGVMAGHAPFITSLAIGEIKLELENGTKYFATSGGTIEVLPHKVTILAETAEDAHVIDVERAIYAKERAQRRLSEKLEDSDLQRARIALLKSINRLKISQKAKR